MAYKSVVWTAKTPITADRLAQMQQNIEYVRSLIEGASYTPEEGAAQGVGKGICTLQELKTIIDIPAGQTIQLGSTFTPITEAGRRYLFQCFLPRVHSYTGSFMVLLYRNDVQVAAAMISPSSNLDEFWQHYGSVQINYYADSGTVGVHLTPGASTTDSYAVKVSGIFSQLDSKVYCDESWPGYIKFEDVGPAS